MSLTVNLLEALVQLSVCSTPDCRAGSHLPSAAASPGGSGSLQIPPVEGGGSRVKAPARLRGL